MKKLLSVFPSSVVSALFNLIVAFIVISHFGIFLWGSFLSIFLWLVLSSVIVSFGVKEYLGYMFISSPSEMPENFQSAVKARLPLAILVSLIILALPFGIIHGAWMSVWLLGRTISLCYEPVVNYQNKPSRILFSELFLGVLLVFLILSCNDSISKFDLLQFFAIAEIMKAILLIVWHRKEFPFPISLRFDFSQLKESFPFLVISLTSFIYLGAYPLISSFYLTAENLAIFYLMITFLLFVSLLIGLISGYKLNTIYSFSEDSITRISLKMLTAGGILSPVYLFACSWLLFTFCNYSTDILFLISGFFFIISICFYSPFLISLHRMKEDRNLFRLNLGIIFVTCISLPFIFNYYGIQGALIYAGSIQVLQAISLRLLAKKVF